MSKRHSSELSAKALSEELDLLLGGVDRSLSIPLAVQLRGALEYGILMGALPLGARLPTVREIAKTAGVTPMTIVGVYNHMKNDGLIETRGKAGTFVAGLPSVPNVKEFEAVSSTIDALLDHGQTVGLEPRRIAELVEVRARLRELADPSGLDILLVGLFEPATKGYEDRLKPILHPSDRLSWTTLDALRKDHPKDPPDFVLTLITRRAEVQAEFPKGVPVGGINFIPSSETRIRLAEIEPEARVGIVSKFAEFAALMRPTVQRFAPHVASIATTFVDDPDLGAFLCVADVVVFASGAEKVLDSVTDGRPTIEYRHMPDINALRTDIFPLMEELREIKTLKRRG